LAFVVSSITNIVAFILPCAVYKVNDKIYEKSENRCAREKLVVQWKQMKETDGENDERQTKNAHDHLGKGAYAH
jgi:hypothetical protein